MSPSDGADGPDGRESGAHQATRQGTRFRAPGWLPRRFDSTRLKPVLPGEVEAYPCNTSCLAAQRLIAACRLGAGPATRPLWQPWAAPRIEWPFGVFHVADAQVARRACLTVDGSDWMSQARSAAMRWRLRLAAQAADAAWWRPLAEHDAWDAGIAHSVAALQGFVPRRATLIVVEGVSADVQAGAVLARLQDEAWNWPRAVRVVWAGGPVPTFARPLSA